MGGGAGDLSLSTWALRFSSSPAAAPPLRAAAVRASEAAGAAVTASSNLTPESVPVSGGLVAAAGPCSTIATTRGKVIAVGDAGVEDAKGDKPRVAPVVASLVTVGDDIDAPYVTGAAGAAAPWELYGTVTREAR